MNLSKAPEHGMMYALYTGEVIYRPYDRNQLPSEEEIQDGLLELHLFDECREYRFIRAAAENIELCVDDETISYHDMDEKNIYADTYIEGQIITLKKGQEMPDKDKDYVEIVNYISYDDNDLMTINNYRLKEVR
ncbi:MAG TPA: hypothetical protein DCS73_00735 [Roseburia sp.]|nr:hypothetical protein [Roseburia sp.]